MIARRLRCVADVMLAALSDAVGVVLMLTPYPVANAAGLALYLFAFAMLAEERAHWHQFYGPKFVLRSWMATFYRGNG